MAKSKELQEVLSVVTQLQEDHDIPKTVKLKLGNIATQLQSGEVSLSVNRILADLEEISNDANMDAFVRTQLFNLSAMLERLV
ncbi:MAG TPA: UPF0147 family protein [Candidatus Nanoarchaeia archaeon]|nr:UPF0147 family protein [Candidatus Nanoarchaeia archaeon]